MGSNVQWVPGHRQPSKHDPRVPRHRTLPRGGRGFVYFVQAGHDGPIKIGWTIDIAQRLTDLQIASPFILRLLAVIDGDKDLERALHERLASHRLRGEWFENHADVRGVTDEYPATGTPSAHRDLGMPCSNCGSMAPIYADGLCEACREFADARLGETDPFDESMSRDDARVQAH
jgi:hypothetical protein